jgi:pimeloyl-ACP methyl ester carboxylesterase
MPPITRLSTIGNAGSASVLVMSLLTNRCAAQSQTITGAWIGDLRRPAMAERMEVDVDTSGRSARISLLSWGLDKAIASSIPAGAESLAFRVVVDKDTVRVQGIARDGAWIGAAERGTEVIPFELRQLQPLTEREWRAIIGTYRTKDGRLLGIAPFSEFGARPLLVDYSTGRIGPVYPIARDRFLVGHALMTPVFPADTLELTYGPTKEVRGLRFVERDHSPVLARRMATKDLEIEFRNEPVVLRGTLTLPSGPPPYPALVLVHGSNALTRDVFGPWSRYFAGLGFAVLAYDKRGTGHSTGDWKQADFPTLATDVLAGVRFLAARPDIRADQIGLWGASQAGWIMPLVAAEAPREIAFLVVHAGSGTTVREEGVLYIENELRFAGLPDSSVAIGTRYQMLDDSVTQARGGWEQLQQYYETHRTEAPWLWPPRPADDWFRPYYRMLMDFDPTPSWKRVTCPVLFFFGELDANVPPKASWPPIERALFEGGNRNVTQFLLPRANHLFLEAQTGARDEYPGLSRFVPGYFDGMARWLQTEGR